MGRKFLLKLAMTLTLFLSTVAFFAVGLTATAAGYQNVIVPRLKDTTEGFLVKKDNSGIVEKSGAESTDLKDKAIVAQVEKADQKLVLNFNNVKENHEADKNIAYKLPDLASDEKYFAILVDKNIGPNAPIGRQFLNKNTSNVYSCEFDAPYFSDMVEFYIYKQKITDPDFKIDEANFIGKTKTLMTHDSVYERQAEISVTRYDADNNAITTGGTTLYLNRITPNYYSLRSNDAGVVVGWDKIAKIVLPDNQKNLLSEEYSVILGDYFKPGASPASGTWNNAAVEAGYFNFYIPEQVNEFTIEVYSQKISNTLDYKINIKLNRA